MNEKSLRRRQTEMESIWNSFEWLIKDKLISIDNNARAMIAEMKTMSVPRDMMMEFLPRKYAELERQVIEEQERKYGKER